MEPKYAAPLYDNWDPPKLLHREDELREMLSRAAETSMPSNLWVEGSKGLGKTLTCKFFMDEVASKGLGRPFYLQCGTSLNNSIRRVCEEEGIRIRQRELNPLGFVNAALKAFPEEGRFYFIVDDPENVKDLRVVDGFIRDVYNALTAEGKAFSIMMVTRMSLKYAERTMESLRSDSRLCPYPIVFKSYSAPEIINILEQRLQFVFEDSGMWDRKALAAIAKHVSRVGSDIRDALSILRQAVKIAGEKLTAGDAEKAVEHSKNAWWRAELLALPPHWAFMLYLAAKSACIKGDVAEVDAQTVITKYKEEVRRLGADPLSKTPMYNALKRMGEIRGLFDLEKVRRGWHETLILRFDEGSVRHITQAGAGLDWEVALPDSRRIQLRT